MRTHTRARMRARKYCAPGSAGAELMFPQPTETRRFVAVYWPRCRQQMRITIYTMICRQNNY